MWWFKLSMVALEACSVSSEPPGVSTAGPHPANPERIVALRATVTAMTGQPSVPGTEGSAELDAALQQALHAKGGGHIPRTEHLHDDGSPRFVNRLILETSPYLLQHAHNPVNWYPWGDEAFARARAEGKPVLLSVGYSTCHWCHVMEKESFEDLEIAAYLNEHFVSIKVDREERPDVDAIYMTAVQLMTGRGGWPMTVVLTPDRKPFFAGTYYPARDGDRRGAPGFLTILRKLHEAYDERGPEVVAHANMVADRIAEVTAPTPGTEVPDADLIALGAHGAARGYDSQHGGFSRAPKFPRSMLIELLLRYHRRTGDPGALRMAEHTLAQMAAGGMYDHLAGGFHRYSVDARWLVPHFEKMLYDNALLTVSYLEAYQVTGDEVYRRVAEETLDYVAAEMTSPGGAFYSATDADSPGPDGEREEGWFHTWTPAELAEVVGADAELVAAWYGVTERGNFEHGRSVLHTPRPLAEVSDAADAQARLHAAKKALYEARLTRPPPLRDDKVLAAWNGMMISAFARGALVVDREDYRDRARRAAAFVLDELVDAEGLLWRSHADGRASNPALLQDYAFMVQALLDLYEVDPDPRWFREARRLHDAMDSRFADRTHGAWFTTADDHEALLAREKPDHDGAQPSANSIATSNALRLGAWTTEDRYRVQATRALRAMGPSMARGTVMPRMLSALDWHHDRALEVLIVVPEGGDGSALEQVVRSTFLPNRVYLCLGEEALGEHVAGVPWLEGKVALGGQPTAYVCEEGLCQRPTHDPEQLRAQLSQVEPYAKVTVRPLHVSSW